MQARVRVIGRGFQRMVVNGCPLDAVETHVPPENLIVSNSNQAATMLRVTDTVQAHVIASVLSQKRTARSAGVYLRCILIACTDTAHG